MYFLFFLALFPTPILRGILLSIRLMTSSHLIVEEIEHLIFTLIRVLILFFVWPTLEGGIKRWILLSILIILSFFCTTSPLILYILLELSLIPIVILIIGWGVQRERIRARLHLIVYTFLFSSPLFLSILLIERGTKLQRGPFLRLFIGIAFIVKTPLFVIHVWLPKAHVEAPTRGSVILARILLKIGGVGFVWTLNYCNCEWNLIYFYCALLGRSLSAIICRLQRDIKAFVAYRRITHINYSTIIVILNRILRDIRRRLLIIRHRFTRRILFITAGICFHSLNTRLIYFLQRAFIFKEAFIVLLFRTLIRNFSIPPFFRLLGEITSLSINLRTFWSIRLSLCIYFIFVSYYSLFLRLSLVGRKGKINNNNRRRRIILLTSIRLIDFLLFGLF